MPRKPARSHDKIVAELDAMEDFLENWKADRRRSAAWPKDWAGIEAAHPTAPKKTSLTLRLDADLVGWFRAQGRGYQARMNAVLRAYMLAKRAEVV